MNRGGTSVDCETAKTRRTGERVLRYKSHATKVDPMVALRYE